ncbi:MAG TPA: glycine cleavage system protein GcvH [Flavisolibacter sp.]|nr:glycine cleavage system protein GcvH [Flavisolibacter sp.]
MLLPNDYKYSKEHTWLKTLDHNQALVGITEFAQSELGEIVYVDLPQVGKQFKKDEVFGSVEAVKTTSDLFMPVSGEVVEINGALKEHAALVNSDSFTDGWMIKIQLLDATETDTLLEAQAYESLVS